MPARLVTRLHGHRVVLSRHLDSDLGPMWVGDYRDEAGRPLALRQYDVPGNTYGYPVICGPTLLQTLQGLDRLGADWRFRP